MLPGFPFWPNTNRRRVSTFSGIPVLHTRGVNETDAAINYNISNSEWYSLPCEGVCLVEIRPANISDPSLPVNLEVPNGAGDDDETLMQVVHSDDDPVLADELRGGSFYMAHYNKRTGEFQLLDCTNGTAVNRIFSNTDAGDDSNA